MLRGLIYGLSILHIGPGFSFAVVAFGCDGNASSAGLESICQQDTFAAFIKLTLAAWGVMITLLMLKIIITNYINKNK
ncbi:hypothetical protein [Methylophilus methylotrophus]|uniref:hypothetical protein n=1 Tax=Methylophilus methylotrophus TaxID=17 RepID=UPI00037DB65F|nr:hypothetical protein [Methylophilus methylotrophus]